MDQLDQAPLSSTLTAGRLKAIAHRQWWVVLACGLIAALGAAAYAEKRPVHYTADIAVTTGIQAYQPGQSAPSVSLPDPLAEAESYEVAKAASSAAGGATKLSAALSPDGSQVELAVQAQTPSGATLGAEAAARAFIKLRAHDIDTEAFALSPQLRSLANEIASLDRQGGRSLPATAGPTSTTALPTRLSTELGVLTSQYTALYTQQVQLQLAAQSVQVDHNSPIALSASGGSKKRLVAMGLGVGLLAGCGLGLLRDLATGRLTEASEVPELSALPLLAAVPVRRLRRKGNLLGSFEGNLGEASRELRTSLSVVPNGKPPRVVLVTSAASREGKSFVAASLAIAYAIGGARTVLVSSDLRQPAVEGLLGVGSSQSHGLATWLKEWPASQPVQGTTGGEGAALAGNNARIPAQRAPEVPLAATGLPSLSLVPAGPLPPNPADLLASRAMEAFVGWLRSQSDVAVLDSPPLLAVTDAAVLSKYADATVLVVAKGRSSKPNVRRAISLLRLLGTPLAGYVLNMTSRSSHVPYRYARSGVKLNGATSRVPAGKVRS